MKRSFFRMTSFLLILVLVLSLYSCDEINNGDANNGEVTTTAATTTATTPKPDAGNQVAKKEEIKNIVIIIGDGMGIEHITAGEMFCDDDFAFTNWQYTSVNTDSVKNTGKGPVLTDSAAAGTALATGTLTVNGYIGKDHTGDDVETILDFAKSLDKATGVVTTDTIFGATPSAFSGHSISRSDSNTIILSQLESDVDLLCGHIDSKCTSRVDEIEDAGYEYCDDFDNVDETLEAKKAYWQFSLGGVDADVELCDATVKALEFLDQDKDGFVLMIEQAHIDKYSHNGQFSEMAQSMSSLNDTVDAVLDWLGDRTDTAVLVTADHETGGLTVSSENRYSKLCTDGENNIYYNWSTGDHTNSKVGLFVYGIKVDFSEFDYYGSQHLIKNIDVYNLMYNVLDDPDEYWCFK